MASTVVQYPLLVTTRLDRRSLVWIRKNILDWEKVIILRGAFLFRSLIILKQVLRSCTVASSCTYASMDIACDHWIGC